MFQLIRATFMSLFYDLTVPVGPGPPQCWGLDIILRHTTLSRTPLDEWSAHCRNLNQTTHNTHKTVTSMLPLWLKLTIPASKWSQIHALDFTATKISFKSNYLALFVTNVNIFECNVFTKILVFWKPMKLEWGNSFLTLYSLLAIKLLSPYNYSFTDCYSISQWIQCLIRTRLFNLHQAYTSYWFYTRWNRHKICTLWYTYHIKFSVLTLSTFILIILMNTHFAICVTVIVLTQM